MKSSLGTTEFMKEDLRLVNFPGDLLAIRSCPSTQFSSSFPSWWENHFFSAFSPSLRHSLLILPGPSINALSVCSLSHCCKGVMFLGAKSTHLWLFLYLTSFSHFLLCLAPSLPSWLCLRPWRPESFLPATNITFKMSLLPVVSFSLPTFCQRNFLENGSTEKSSVSPLI